MRTWGLCACFQVLDDAAQGGGLFSIGGGSLTLQHCSFSNNTCGDAGAAVYVMSRPASAAFLNTTFAHNQVRQSCLVAPHRLVASHAT